VILAPPEPVAPATDTKNGPPVPVPTDLRLSVVIPVYNERGTIAEIIRRVRAVPIDKEIIVVDDGSTDGTRELLTSLAAEPDVRIHFHARNGGKGAALKTGFARATGDIIVVQDADLEYDPADFRRLIEPILDNRAEVVFGSRFLSHDSRCVLSFGHRLANRALTMLSNFFCNLSLTDMETCYKVFRRDVVEALAPRLQQNGFGIEPELTARVARGGYRICEVGISYEARTRREGKKIRWRDGAKALWCIVRYSWW